MGRADRDQDRVFVWRELAAFSKLQLLLEVTGEIVVPRKLDRRTKRGVGLYENFSRRFAAAGPARDLSKQLKGPFTRAEIRKVQRQIRVDDSDQRHVRK